MLFDALNKKTDGYREEAASAKNYYRSQRAAIMNDKTLSEEGKAERIGPLLEKVNTRRAELEALELKAINDRVADARSTLRYRAGGSTHDVIAERDAEDRADRIEGEAEALRILNRSLPSDDRSLTQAIIRKAIDNGWEQAIDAVGAKYPLIPESATVIRSIDAHLANPTEVMTRTLAYGALNEQGS